MLLRIAIGWHFAAEGVYKIMSTPEAKGSILAQAFPTTEGPTFSSEGYLRNSSGPFGPKFRGLIPDVESRSKLSLESLKQLWSAEMQAIGGHYGFDEAQREKAGEILKAKEAEAEAWFLDKENRDKIAKYFNDLDTIHAGESEKSPMSFQVERTRDLRKTVEADRKSLVAVVDGWTKSLKDEWLKSASEAQVAESGPYAPSWTQLDKVDRLTMYGLTVVGFCLMIGFLTPIAALGGAGYLLLFYLSMPPWPGLPESPIAEGHYVIVNKNLIEMFACLALSVIPTWRWIGVDAFLLGLLGRSKPAEPVTAAAAAGAGAASDPSQS